MAAGPRVMIIANSLMGRCGFSHEHVDNRCKVTCEDWELKM